MTDEQFSRHIRGTNSSRARRAARTAPLSTWHVEEFAGPVNPSAIRAIFDNPSLGPHLATRLIRLAGDLHAGWFSGQAHQGQAILVAAAKAGRPIAASAVSAIVSAIEPRMHVSRRRAALSTILAIGDRLPRSVWARIVGQVGRDPGAIRVLARDPRTPEFARKALTRKRR